MEASDDASNSAEMGVDLETSLNDADNNMDRETKATEDAEDLENINEMNQDDIMDCITLSSSNNSSSYQSSISKSSEENDYSRHSINGSERLDFSNLDFSTAGFESRDSSTFNASAYTSLDHSTAVSSDNEESFNYDQNFSMSELNINEGVMPKESVKNIEIRTVPEDDDLFNMDNIVVDGSFQLENLDMSSAQVTNYDSDESDSVSSYSSGFYETDSSDGEPIIQEDLATLARGTYPVKRAPGRPKVVSSNITPTTTERTPKRSRPTKEEMSARLQERLDKSKLVTDRWLKDLEVPENLSFNLPVMIPVVELNQYLTCGLCFGYLYEASTVTECMHTCKKVFIILASIT